MNTSMDLDADYGDFPLKQYLGMQLDDGAAGHAQARITIAPEHLNPNAVVHGAVLYALIDTAMGKATMSVLDEGQFCATVELAVRFIRPASEGEVIAEVSVLKRGRAVVHLDARVHDGNDRLIATGSGTYTVIEL